MILIPGMQRVQAPRLVIHGRTQVPVAGHAGRSAQVINDLVVTGDRIVVTEGETNSLVVVALDGQTLFTKSNTGPDAAMLAHPIQMAITAANEVLVLDAQTPRLASFSFAGESLELSSIQRLRGITGVTGVCSMNGRTFVRGSTLPSESSRLVHVLGDDGEVQASFGRTFGSSTEFGRLFYGAGRLLCIPSEGLMVATSNSYPEVRAYDADGSLLWSQEIPDFRQVTYTEISPGRFRYVYPPDDTWDTTVSAFAPAEGIVAVQIGRRHGRQPGTPLSNIVTRLFSTVDGRPISVQSDLPLVKGAGAGRLFAVDELGSLAFLSYSLQEE